MNIGGTIMEIYNYAKSINYAADYMDMHTMYTYHIQDYGNCLKNNLQTDGILVTDCEGNIVGIARKPEGWVD